MKKQLAKSVLRLLSAFVVLFLAIGVFTIVKNFGWLSPIGINSESHDSQVIRAIERTQEVSLLSLGIQGIKDDHKNAEIWGHGVPGTAKAVYLQYNFNAKLGVDGARVNVTRTGNSAYRISVPKFSFIGYDKLTFKVAVEDNGLLSWVTPDIDKAEMVTKILNDDARETYIASNESALREQTEVFYNRLVTSIDPSAETTFEFSS